ncbi:sterol desaturase family protein [Roseivirga sp. E12]|uniref:sterol desaturase family protein n=1 Tax=Roseivirga sp. E12 TaxID=2819237 RepID=UPI001F3C49B9|nr:sterol desaturase family protein [Roseivirga sp. E12]
MNPLEILIDPVSLVVIGMFLFLYAWESMFPRKKDLPKIKYATIRGIVSFFVFFYLGSYLPLLTDEYLASYQLINLSGLDTVLQVVIGLLFYQFLLYFYHSAMHKSDTLWRIFHQMHHSSERLDIPSTYYFSLMDMIGFTLLASVCFAFFMGLSPIAISIVIFSLNFLSQFQHANIHTPHWLGWFIQRPEQHAVHHQRGEHKYNYSDFPIYDYLFGTFQNPRDNQNEAGFYDGASARIKDMLLFKDVSEK